MSSGRNIRAVALGVLFAVMAVYWFTIGRRPLLDAPPAEPTEHAE